MAKNNNRIEDVSLKPANNGGFIISYCERSKPLNKSMNTNYDYKSEVFEDGTKAISRMQELMGIESKSEDKNDKD